MKRYTFNKLIRSKLPARMIAEGVSINSQTLAQPEYTQQLKQKILEEAQEVAEATSRESLAIELADVMEVIRAIAEAENISLDEIEAERIKKREANGHFEPEHYVHYIEVAPDNHKVIDYLENKNRPYIYSEE